MFHSYAELRNRIFSNGHHKETADEEEAPLSCSGVSGIVFLILIFVGSVAFVAYALYARRLATEADIRLLWLAVLFWLLIANMVFKRLVILGMERGGRFYVFVRLQHAMGKIWKKKNILFIQPWEKLWSKCTVGPGSSRKLRKQIRKM